MNAREACEAVLGKNAAAGIIADQGLHWAVIAAMSACMVSHGPKVKAALSAYADEMKRGYEAATR